MANSRKDNQTSCKVEITVALHHKLLEFYKFEQIIIVWCVGAVTADLLITTTLVYYLVRACAAL